MLQIPHHTGQMLNLFILFFIHNYKHKLIIIHLNEQQDEHFLKVFWGQEFSVSNKNSYLIIILLPDHSQTRQSLNFYWVKSELRTYIIL